MISDFRLRAAVFAACAGLVLTGCIEGGVLSSMGGAHGPRAATSMQVAGGALRVTGPDGYCVDAASSRAGEADGFVLLGSCRAISHHPRDPHPDRPMVLTVAASAGSGGSDLDALEAHLRSTAGRRALSRGGQAGSVTVTRALQQDGVLYLHVRDNSAHPMGAMAQDCWRAFFDLNGVMVSLTVTALASQPVAEEPALALTQQAVMALRAANPASGATLAGLADRFRWRNNSDPQEPATPAPTAAARPPAR